MIRLHITQGFGCDEAVTAAALREGVKRAAQSGKRKGPELAMTFLRACASKVSARRILSALLPESIAALTFCPQSSSRGRSRLVAWSKLADGFARQQAVEVALDIEPNILAAAHVQRERRSIEAQEIAAERFAAPGPNPNWRKPRAIRCHAYERTFELRETLAARDCRIAGSQRLAVPRARGKRRIVHA